MTKRPFDQTDRRVLAAIDLDASISIQEVAKRTGLKQVTVSYRLRKLFDAGALKEMRMAINRTALGLSDYIVYFQGVAGGRREFISAAQKIDEITWLAELGGYYQWGVTISSRRPVAVQRTLEKLSATSTGIAGRALVIRHKLTNYPRRYLAAIRAYSTPLEYGAEGSEYKPDKLSASILKLGTTEGFRSIRDLASKLGMPASSLQKRIKAMEDSGLLVRLYYPFDPTAAGISVHQIFVCLRNVGRNINELIHRFAIEQSMVTGVMECSGAWDYMLIVELDDRRQLPILLQALFDRLGNELMSLQSSEVLAYRKASSVVLDL